MRTKVCVCVYLSYSEEYLLCQLRGKLNTKFSNRTSKEVCKRCFRSTEEGKRRLNLTRFASFAQQGKNIIRPGQASHSSTLHCTTQLYDIFPTILHVTLYYTLNLCSWISTFSCRRVLGMSYSSLITIALN